MKKYVVYIILAFAVMFFLPSCENGGDVDFADNTLTLTLSCNDLGLTRATVDGEDTYNENTSPMRANTKSTTVDGEDTYNENTINSIDCYFYPSNADFNTQALVVKNNISTLTKQPAFGTYTASIKFEEEELKTLFGTVNKGGSANALIYIIANRPTNVSLPMADGVVKLATINELKALTITSDFTKPQAQAFFVMDSDGNPDSTNDTSVAGATNTDIDNDDIVTYTIDNNGTKSLTGVVPLYRTAAKITLSVNRFGQEGDNNTVTVGGKTYTPNYGGVYAVFHNGVSNSVIAPDVVSQVAPPSYFETADFSMAAQAAPCQLGVPFYSYASDWSGETAGEEAYITLVVPWQANGETAYTPYYYKVPVNFSGDKLERNTHYKIDIAVSILGTLNPDRTITIEPSYTILDWSNDTIPTSMSDFRYLMVEQNSYVMNNINTINIPYWTSHNCTKVNVSVKKPDLYNGGDRTIDVTSGYDLDLTTKDGNAYITYSRVLNNDYTSSTFDFAPYTIRFRIQHTTESTKYYEDITITQYPAIYGQAQVNLDHSNGGGDNDSRYTMVNGYYSKSQNNHTNLNNQDFFASCIGLYQGFSPNMYVFTVTSVEGTDYVIGDPRTTEIDTELVNAKRVYRNTNNANNTAGAAWVTAKALYDGVQNRKLKYYYPTEVDYTSAQTMQNSRTENMIAPKFRIASGYAVLHTDADASNYIEGMKKRCASYQEDGYPAGRWRLPTKAEFEFIFSQVNKEKLPPIYQVGTSYWCAHGVGVPQNDGTVDITYRTSYNTSGDGLSVRCVYDDWYWGSERTLTTDAEKKVFTWGDVPRSEKAYAPSINY